MSCAMLGKEEILNVQEADNGLIVWKEQFSTIKELQDLLLEVQHVHKKPLKVNN